MERDTKDKRLRLPPIGVVLNNERLHKHEYELCRRSFSHWLFRWAYTLDNHADTNIYADKIAPFSKKDYIKGLNKIIFEDNPDDQVILIGKSRQMTITWYICAYIAWYMTFKPNSLALVQSKKGEASNDVLSRIKIILDHLPSFMRVESEQIKMKIRLKNGSIVMGMNEKSKQFRMYTPNVAFIDEAGFVKYVKENIAAVRPGLTGGKDSKCFVVSTPGDEVDFTDMYYDGNPQEGWVLPGMEMVMKGLYTKMNDNNNIRVIALHRHADPTKDENTEEGMKWYVEAREGFGGDDRLWNKEYELDFFCKSGERVYPVELKKIKIPRIDINKLRNEEEYTIYSGTDFGYRAATVFLWCAVNRNNDLIIFDEHYAKEKDVKWHKYKVWQKERMFGFKRIHRVADPAGEKRGITDGLSLYDHYAKEPYPFFFVPGNNEISTGIEMTRELFSRRKIFITENCTNTLKELLNYKYKNDTNADNNPSEKPIDKYNDAMDALRYIVMNNPVYIGRNGMEISEAEVDEQTGYMFMDYEDDYEVLKYEYE